MNTFEKLFLSVYKKESSKGGKKATAFTECCFGGAVGKDVFNKKKKAFPGGGEGCSHPKGVVLSGCKRRKSCRKGDRLFAGKEKGWARTTR